MTKNPQPLTIPSTLDAEFEEHLLKLHLVNPNIPPRDDAWPSSDIEIPDDTLEEIGNIPNTAWDVEYWRKGLDPSVEMPMEADVDGDCTLVDIDTQADTEIASDTSMHN